MTFTRTKITPEGIQEIVRQIVERFEPQKIILFGSYAYGKPTEDSDVDLLVIMETSGNPLHTSAQIATEVDHPFPMDILVWNPAKWEASVERKASFATEVATKGVVLYEAGHRRLG